MILHTLLSLLLFSSLAAAEISQTQVADAFRAKASASGYAVRPGKISLMGIEQCSDAIRIFGNCLGNNPAAPYLVVLVPQLQGEYVDPYYNTSLLLPNEDPSLSGTYRVQPNEAIVLIGTTPPQGAYFGAQSYLFTRKGITQAPSWLTAFDPDAADLFYGPSPNPARSLLFASLSEAMNQVTLAKQQGIASSFNQRFYFVSSADKSTAEAVKRLLVESGAAPAAIHIEAIPSTAKLGLGADADDLATVIRYALPQTIAAGEAWRSSAPIQVMRVSGPAGTLPYVVRYGEQPAPVRTGNEEGLLSPALNQLETEVRAVLGISSQSASQTLLPVSLLGLTGIKCIENGMNCLGDTLDTDTYRRAGNIILDENDVAVVVGVNHTQTQNATYVSLAVVREEYLMGVESVSQTGPAAGFVQGELNDSVDKFKTAYPQMRMPLLLSAAKQKLYVHLFARNCSGLPLCTVVSESAIPKEEEIAFMQRTYLKPGSTMGADVSKLLSPKAITLKR